LACSRIQQHHRDQARRSNVSASAAEMLDRNLLRLRIAQEG